MTPLAEPVTLRSGAVLRSRICKAATAEGLADHQSNPGPAMIELYRRWGAGGAGLIISGNMHVDRRYRERTTSPAIDRQSDHIALRALATAAQQNGAAVWAQLNHAGRQCPASVSHAPVGPVATRAPLRFSGYSACRALELREMSGVVAAFADAASIACEAGFDGVQIHAAHGYLLSSFLSPHVNLRTDRYGGNPLGRARLLLEVVAAVRSALPRGKALSVKLNATDFERGGIEMDDSARIVAWCAEHGADHIELSGGSYRRLYVPEYRPNISEKSAGDRDGAYVREAAMMMAASISVPIMITGGVRDRAIMEALLGEGVTAIGLARPFCVAPDAAAKLLDGTLVDLSSLPTPPQYAPWPFSDRSWSRSIRRLNAFAAQAWYSEQIHQMAHGQEIDCALSSREALRRMIARDRQWLSTTIP